MAKLKVLLACFCFLFPLQSVAASPVLKPQVAIIIDDFGNGLRGTEEMMKMPFPLTVAVMPFLSTSTADAKAAHKAGHEVIIHLPMEPVKGKKSWLGPKPITTDLSNEEIQKRLEEAFKEVPYAVGMNNHMGSKATTDERIMDIIMRFCAEHKLFFVDSGTTPKSVAGAMAKKYHVPFFRNELFLDDVHQDQAVFRQLDKLKKQALEEGQATAIGHVGIQGKITARTIKKFYEMEKGGNEKLDYVPISHLIKKQ